MLVLLVKSTRTFLPAFMDIWKQIKTLNRQQIVIIRISQFWIVEEPSIGKYVYKMVTITKETSKMHFAHVSTSEHPRSI